MIYVIFGASGSGKTTLLNCVFQEFGQQAVNKKGSTREKRSYDCFDEVESFPGGLPDYRFGDGKAYVYSQYGYDYGIEKIQLDRAIENGYPHFVVCNDVETIKKLRRDYANFIRVGYLRFDAAEEDIRNIQKKRGINDDEISLRVSKIEYLNTLYIKNSEMFDFVLTNHQGKNPEVELWRQMKAIMASYDDYREPPTKEVLRDLVNQLEEKILHYSYNVRNKHEGPIEKDFIFVIMAMNDQDENIKEQIHQVYTTITNAAQETGFRAARVDRIDGNGFIDDKIFENIKKAEVVVADLSYERPNCYLEFGYALALGKTIVLLYREGTKLHFDVEHFDKKIKYKKMTELSESLKGVFLQIRQK